MDAAAFAVFHEGHVEGVHQDDSSQARGVSALHVVQQHLSFVHLVTDDCGDFSWKDTSMQEHTHPCVSTSRRNKQNKRTLLNWIQVGSDSKKVTDLPSLQVISVDNYLQLYICGFTGVNDEPYSVWAQCVI